MKIWLALIAVLILSGCASSGREIDQNQVDQIEIGATTFDDMVSRFGPPMSQGYNGEGKIVASWIYVFVGPFGTGMEQQILAVQFDESKVVEQFNMTQGDPGGVRLGR